ncbi:probable oligoribonuclease isoform X1 [Drosophila willistoni]|uniref:probable oligoribonuclease isoform X1 n=1 Tax=Drosophila willistoni TaxID=7260 RepID=UPI001F084D1D|nr:probable oligoribonuclease isoform X1 [Drosophila willistoni]
MKKQQSRLTKITVRATGLIQVNNMTTANACDQKGGKNTYMVWMDLEMTGLDIQKDKILEVSCLITDKDLNIQSNGLSFAINHPQEVYEQMNEWCIKQHYASGLVDSCKKSTVTPEAAEDLILTYLKQNIPEKTCVLAGNSVYMDRLFLYKYMPIVNKYLHYRIVDVSTIKELARRWNPDIIEKAPKKAFAHRSLDDIKDSIAELKFYKEHLFK